MYFYYRIVCFAKDIRPSRSPAHRGRMVLQHNLLKAISALIKIKCSGKMVNFSRAPPENGPFTSGKMVHLPPGKWSIFPDHGPEPCPEPGPDPEPKPLDSDFANATTDSEPTEAGNTLARENSENLIRVLFPDSSQDDDSQRTVDLSAESSQTASEDGPADSPNIPDTPISSTNEAADESSNSEGEELSSSQCLEAGRETERTILEHDEYLELCVSRARDHRVMRRSHNPRLWRHERLPRKALCLFAGLFLSPLLSSSFLWPLLF